MAECKKYPYKISEIDLDADEIFQNFKGINDSQKEKLKHIVQCGDKKYAIPDLIKKYCWSFYNFEIRENDVWCIGFPRTGTTLTREIIWLIANDLDFDKAKNISLNTRFPSIHHGMHVEQYRNHSDIKDRIDTNVTKEEAVKFDFADLEEMNEMKGRRFVKSHIPPSLFPSKLLTTDNKIIYCARNPKDTIVSYYHLQTHSQLPGKLLSFPEFFKLFKANLVYYTPFFEHLKEGWNLRNSKNVLFLFYEDTRKNLRETLIKIAKFLDKNLSEDDLDKLETHLNIDNFRQNKTVNTGSYVKLKDDNKKTDVDSHFIRKGEIGGWRNYFKDGLNEEADKWIAENLKGTDIKFPE